MTQLVETDPGVKQLKKKMGFEKTELSGRVIRALYDDSNLLTLSGKTIITGEEAERYGLSDLDGYEPKSLCGIYGGPHPAFDIQVRTELFNDSTVGVISRLLQSDVGKVGDASAGSCSGAEPSASNQSRP